MLVVAICRDGGSLTPDRGIAKSQCRDADRVVTFVAGVWISGSRCMRTSRFPGRVALVGILPAAGLLTGFLYLAATGTLDPVSARPGAGPGPGHRGLLPIEEVVAASNDNRISYSFSRTGEALLTEYLYLHYSTTQQCTPFDAKRTGNRPDVHPVSCVWRTWAD